jgi:excisionase family DNA binding protein
VPLPNGDRWMLPDEVAALFGVSRPTLNRWVRLKNLPAYQPDMKSNVFKKSDVNKLLASKGMPTI